MNQRDHLGWTLSLWDIHPVVQLSRNIFSSKVNLRYSLRIIVIKLFSSSVQCSITFCLTSKLACSAVSPANQSTHHATIMMSRRKRRDWDAISWNVTCVQVRPLCFSSPSQIKYSCHSSPTKTWALPSPRTWSPSFFFYSIIIPRSLIVCERNKQKWSFRSKNGVGSLLVASSIKGGQHERRCNYSAAVGKTMLLLFSA